MVSVCLYFEVHQPFRLRPYSVFDIGKSEEYFDDEKNASIMRKVARKCYLPMNALLLELLARHPQFKASFSITGTALEQMRLYAPDALASFQRLAATGRVELLAETSHHSLSFLYDRDEFAQQVRAHTQQLERLFGQTPSVLRNTELIYGNELGQWAQRAGFSAVLAEGWDPVLGWRSANFVYGAKGAPKVKLLLKNYRLSDDVAFRFSDRGWSEWPLTVDKYASWIDDANGNGHVVNLFMDYETFGEHQWEDTGIFAFMRALPARVLAHPHNAFATVSEAARNDAMDELDFPSYVSWADAERDLSAWIGNGMQQAALDELYRLAPAVREAGDPALLERWRKLTTSDHFYYMCTKWFSDGDVHRYFNPYESPYEAHIAFMNVLHDLALRLNVRLRRKGGTDEARTPRARAFVTQTPSAQLRVARRDDARSGGDRESSTQERSNFINTRSLSERGA